MHASNRNIVNSRTTWKNENWKNKLYIRIYEYTNIRIYKKQYTCIYTYTNNLTLLYIWIYSLHLSINFFLMIRLSEYAVLQNIAYNSAFRRYKKWKIPRAFKDKYGIIQINEDINNEKRIIHTPIYNKIEPIIEKIIPEPIIENKFWKDDCTKTLRQRELYEEEVKLEYKKRNMNYREVSKFFETNHRNGSHIGYLNVSDTLTKEQYLIDVNAEMEEFDKSIHIDIDTPIIFGNTNTHGYSSDDNKIKIIEDNWMSLYDMQEYLESLEKEDQYISSKLIELYTEMLWNDDYNQDNLKEIITFSKILEWAERDISVEDFIEEKRISRELTHEIKW